MLNALSVLPLTRDDRSGSVVASQPSSPHITSVQPPQPPQPVVAPVSRATSSTGSPPQLRHATTSPFVTPSQRQTVVRSGMSVGEATGTAAPATGRTRS